MNRRQFMGSVAAGLCGLAVAPPAAAPGAPVIQRPVFLGRVHDEFVYEVDLEHMEAMSLIMSHRHMYPEAARELDRMIELGRFDTCQNYMKPELGRSS